MVFAGMETRVHISRIKVCVEGGGCRVQFRVAVGVYHFALLWDPTSPGLILPGDYAARFRRRQLLSDSAVYNAPSFTFDSPIHHHCVVLRERKITISSLVVTLCTATFNI